MTTKKPANEWTRSDVNEAFLAWCRGGPVATFEGALADRGMTRDEAKAAVKAYGREGRGAPKVAPGSTLSTHEADAVLRAAARARRFDPGQTAVNVAKAYAEAQQRGCITQQIFEELGFDCEVACAACLTISQAFKKGRTFNEAFEAAARVLCGEPHEPIPLPAREHEAGPCGATFGMKACVRPARHVGPHVSRSLTQTDLGAPPPAGACWVCRGDGMARTEGGAPVSPYRPCGRCAGLGHVVANRVAAGLPESVKAMVHSGRALRAAVTDVGKALVLPSSQTVVQLDAQTYVVGPRGECDATSESGPTELNRAPYLTADGAARLREPGRFPAPPLPGGLAYAIRKGDPYGSASWHAWHEWAASPEMRADPNVAWKILRLCAALGTGPTTSLDKAIATARADLKADESRLPAAEAYAADMRHSNEAKRAALADVEGAAKGGAS